VTDIRLEGKGSSAVEQPPQQTTPSLRMLADRPLDDESEDRLDFDDYAEAIAELIDHPDTLTPLTIALSAPWGAGKTSLARLVERRLSAWRREWGQPPHIVCWFNAWAHDDATHLGAAFAADVARTVDRARPWWRRLRSPLPAAMLTPRNRWRRRVLIALIALVPAGLLLLVPGVRDLFGGPDLERDLEGALGATLGSVAVLLLAAFAVWKYVLAASERAARFLDDPGSEAARGTMREVSEELGRLIAQATCGRRKLVVFVDDLERCRPPRAVQVCEAASNLLGHPDVVTVLIADMRVIASSAELQYRQLEWPDDAPDRSPGAYGRRYLQKIVQIQFDLPPMTEERVRRVLDDVAEAPAFDWPSASEPARGRVRYHLEVAGSILSALVVVGSGAYFAARPPDAADDRGTAFFTGALGAVFVLFVVIVLLRMVARIVGFVVARVLSWRARRRLDAIDESIKAQSRDLSPAAVELTVKEEHHIEEGSPEEKLVADRVARYFTQESPLRDQAEAEIVAFLPDLTPRAAKRMMNHLRLQLYVAIKRRLLGTGSELTPEHLGKWVVLGERWPELARGVGEEPGRLLDLEGARSVYELRRRLTRLGLNAEASADLIGFVQADPKLGPVANQLVFLEPA
jgi:KAP family P-loop domain